MSLLNCTRLRGLLNWLTASRAGRRSRRRREAMEPSSLYRRVLGPQFDVMPEVLRRFHDTKGGGSARGTLRVERGAGWLERALATLLRLPHAGTEVPVRLVV